MHKTRRLLVYSLFVQFCLSMITVGILQKVAGMSWLPSFLYASVLTGIPAIWYFYIGFVLGDTLSEKETVWFLPPNHNMDRWEYSVKCSDKPCRLWGDTFFDVEKGKIS